MPKKRRAFFRQVLSSLGITAVVPASSAQKEKAFGKFWWDDKKRANVGLEEAKFRADILSKYPKNVFCSSYTPGRSGRLGRASAKACRCDQELRVFMFDPESLG